MKKFKAPKKTFGDLDAATIAHMISASSDLALVLDSKGVVRDLALEDDELSDYGCNEWIGRSMLDIVTPESRAKVEEMLQAAIQSGASKWRQVNHPAASGQDLPIRYSATRLAEDGRVLAIGRDLRPMSALQQRLISAQAQMENEYSRLRVAETRYQTLFQLSAEAVIVLDANSLKVAEANPAASVLLNHESTSIVGRNFLELLDKDSREAVQKLLARVHVAPRAEEISIPAPAGGGEEFSLSASVFRSDTGTHYLLRLAAVQGEAGRSEERSVNEALLDVIEKMPDGLVVIDEHREILTANAAFLNMAQLADKEQVRGQKIERWLGRVEVDVDILLANVREYGFLRRFPTVVRGEYGSRDEIELSAVAVLDRDSPCFGLAIRKVQPALSVNTSPRPAGPRSFEQLKELVGRVPLRDLVRETTDIIEQMCIEAALELTGDNRASAAEMLGLSRQSFYVKLRRHGLGELDSQESN